MQPTGKINVITSPVFLPATLEFDNELATSIAYVSDIVNHLYYRFQELNILTT
jgi:hypothetical protein